MWKGLKNVRYSYYTKLTASNSEKHEQADRWSICLLSCTNWCTIVALCVSGAAASQLASGGSLIQFSPFSFSRFRQALFYMFSLSWLGWHPWSRLEQLKNRNEQHIQAAIFNSWTTPHALPCWALLSSINYKKFHCLSSADKWGLTPHFSSSNMFAPSILRFLVQGKSKLDGCACRQFTAARI